MNLFKSEKSSHHSEWFFPKVKPSPHGVLTELVADATHSGECASLSGPRPLPGRPKPMSVSTYSLESERRKKELKA